MAYDRIMNFPGKFADSLLPDQLHTLNVSFCIDRLEEKTGGNAGNIAHSLALLGEAPIIVASVGKDFDRYATLLQQRGLPLVGITRLDDELTAGAYIMTDQANNQITAFHAAAMMTPSNYAFPSLDPIGDIAYIGPSNLHDMNSHPALYKEKGIRYIYDPAQQLPVLTVGQLLTAIQGAWLLVSNEYEFKLIMKITGRSRKDLAAMTRKGIITTFGENGSLVTDNESGEEKTVPAAPVIAIADPTGAGDAYRAGLIKGILLGLPLYASACLGATCAAFCVECLGTQGHNFSEDEFFSRHNGIFDNS
jgi:adenosine kinase